MNKLLIGLVTLFSVSSHGQNISEFERGFNAGKTACKTHVCFCSTMGGGYTPAMTSENVNNAGYVLIGDPSGLSRKDCEDYIKSSPACN